MKYLLCVDFEYHERQLETQENWIKKAAEPGIFLNMECIPYEGLRLLDFEYKNIKDVKCAVSNLEKLSINLYISVLRKETDGSWVHIDVNKPKRRINQHIIDGKGSKETPDKK